MHWIKEIVEGLIEVFNTRDIYELINSLNIILIKTNLDNCIKGRFLRDMFNNEYIYVSDTVSDKEEKIIIAHELGHAILHPDLSASYYTENHLFNKDKIEYQANKFAAELLIPDDLDLSIYDSITIEELSKLLKVSEELVLLKLKKTLNKDLCMVAENKEEYQIN